MTEPWLRADTEIDEAIATRLLGAQFPGFGALRRFNEGWGNRVFLASRDGEEWVFRFPKIRGSDAALAIEVSLLAELGPALPLAVPRFECVGRPDGGYPFRFVGYRKLRGVESHFAWGRFDPAAAGAAMGRLLSVLHAFPAERATALGVEEARWSLDLEARAVDSRKYRQWIPPAHQHILSVLETPPPGYNGPLCLVHGDLAPDHVLVEDGAVSGIIDWGDVGLGDPARDLAGVWYVAGRTALDACLGVYAGALDEGWASRVRFFLAYALIMDLAWASATQRDSIMAGALRVLDEI